MTQHRPEPIYRAPTWEEHLRGVYVVEVKVCRFCDHPIQHRGLLRRWTHVA